MNRSETHQQQLLRKEAQFWDLQEERIASLYARPHDWHFVPKIANVIVRPRERTFLRLLDAHRHDIRSLVDIGCGNGFICHATAKRGIRSIGLELSAKKVEVARRMAKEQGVAHLCEFHVADAAVWQPPAKVDLLTSTGSLHHFPDFANALDRMQANMLKPDGYMLFVEPHHEGMAPEVAQFLLKCANHRLLKRFFDIDFYLEVTGKQTIDEPDAEHGHEHGHEHGAVAPAGDEPDIRDESPAGKEFFGEHIDLDAFFCANFDVIEKEFYHYFASHASNAFYVFMKSKLIRGLWRLLLPWLVRRDTRLLRRPEYQRWAESGLWFMRRKAAR